MISEKPLFGWRPVEFWYELGKTVYWLLADKGCPQHSICICYWKSASSGPFRFIIGLWFCRPGSVERAQRHFWPSSSGAGADGARRQHVGTDIARKHLWFVLAIAVATEPVVARRRAAEWSPARFPGLRPRTRRVTLPQHSPPCAGSQGSDILIGVCYASNRALGFL